MELYFSPSPDSAIWIRYNARVHQHPRPGAAGELVIYPREEA
jgi:hypothetical protein